MADVAGMTFGELHRALESYGLEVHDRPDCLVYSDPDGRPMLLLPRYKDDDEVRPIHVLTARRHLIAAGLLDDAPPTLGPRVVPAAREQAPAIAPRS